MKKKINEQKFDQQFYGFSFFRYNKKFFEKVSIYIYQTLPARAGYDTRSIFKRSLTGLNQGFPSPRLVAPPTLKKLICPTIYP